MGLTKYGEYQLIKQDFDALNVAMNTTYGVSIGSERNGDYFVSEEAIFRYDSVNVNVTTTLMNALGKTWSQVDISASKILRIFDYIDNNTSRDVRIPPFDVLFNRQLDRFLFKGPISYDERGRPIEIIYYEDATKVNPVAKRTFQFIDFDAPTIQALLGLDVIASTVLEDKLVWQRKETFHWATLDGSWSSIIKVRNEDFIPFVAGQPDLATYYDKRVAERKIGRTIIFDRLQPIVSKFIAIGLQTTNLILIRTAGRNFLKRYSTEINEYIKTGDESVIDLIILNTEDAFLDYGTDIVGVTDVRQFVVNSLRQLKDLTVAI